jgi:pilus assembly protein CpaC
MKLRNVLIAARRRPLFRKPFWLWASALMAASLGGDARAQDPMAPPPRGAVGPSVPQAAPLPSPLAPQLSTTSTVPSADRAPPEVQAKVENVISDIQGPEVRLDLMMRKSKLIRTRLPIVRVSIADPSIVEAVQFGPNEFELIGSQPGETTLTIWFAGPQPTGFQPNLRYLIRVSRDLQNDERARIEYGELQKRINELFPNSYVQLIPVADKLIVRGQARDGKEATQIMGVLRGGTVDQTGAMLGPGSWAGFGGGIGGIGANQGTAARIPGAEDLPSSAIVNMLEVPGEQQVMLRVRVAELTRAALRSMGANLTVGADDFSFSSLLGVAGPTAILNSKDVQLTLSMVASNQTSKVLAEPNLITLSGYPASFIAGGQFAVPTAVGINGIGAATTSFQGFGTMIQFTPTVLDKDHIRLQVTPTFSTINSANTVNNIPGLNVRSVTTTVDLKEGQWLAIAGLLQDQQAGSKVRLPWLGDIPLLSIIFSQKTVTRDETELVILVSPELVHPLEPDQSPTVLPGMEVTEPDDLAFFLFGQYEGDPDWNHRSTVWPVFRWQEFGIRHQAVKEAKLQSRYQRAERYYIHGASGFSY